MKLVLDRRGRHDSFHPRHRIGAGLVEGPLLEERRLLLQWALGTIAELETRNLELRTENAILWEKSDVATREAERLQGPNRRRTANRSEADLFARHQIGPSTLGPSGSSQWRRQVVF